MDLDFCYPSGAYVFEVASRSLENLCISGVLTSGRGMRRRSMCKWKLMYVGSAIVEWINVG